MAGDSLTFLVATTDPDSDSIRYRVDWGDALSDWSRFFASAESCTIGHRWSVRDTYAIKVQAEDLHGRASEWSADHVVSIESLCRRYSGVKLLVRRLWFLVPGVPTPAFQRAGICSWWLGTQRGLCPCHRHESEADSGTV